MFKLGWFEISYLMYEFQLCMLTNFTGLIVIDNSEQFNDPITSIEGNFN